MTVDELRARRALRKLDQHRHDHPEAFDVDRLPSTPSELAAALGERPRMGRPPSADPGMAVTFRLPRSMLAKLDAALQGRDPPLTRQEAVREAVERWLSAGRRRKR